LRLVLFGLCGAAALYFGFLAFDVGTARVLLRQSGYYVMLLTFMFWLGVLWKVKRLAGGEAAPVPRRELWIAGTIMALLTGMALFHETFRSKILYDEYVLQSTAYNMHFFRDGSAIVRGYDIQGVFLSLDSYVDKRPVFFPFLLSLTHDALGYRPANVYVLNGLLFVVTLGLIYWIGRRLNGWRGGMLAIGLLGSLPLFAQNASGAGMELLNFCMLVVVILQAAAWLRHRDETRLTALVLGVILLVQSRYESAIYVLPAALAILWGWWRAGRVIISWPVVLAPLLFIPVALQQKVVSNTPVMWELHENQTSRFSLAYLEGNVKGAWAFFSEQGLIHANSVLLGALGAVALVVVGGRLVFRWRQLPGLEALRASVLLFSGGMLGITALMMFYYWAAFNDPMAARFALPLNLVFVLAVVVVAALADRKIPATLVLLGAVAVYTLGVSAPKQSYHYYSHLGNDEIEWELRTVAARPKVSRLILSNKSTLPWMVESTPAILLARALPVADRLAEHLHQPDFNEILVTQSARPTSVDGQYQLVPEETLPPWFHLELLAERRFGTKLARISRLVAIDLPPSFQPSNAPPVAAGAAAQPEHPIK
jgi:hypothetical protein